MKNYFAVTISDASGSRHFSVKKTVKRYLALTLVVVAGSVIYNFAQYQQAGALHDQNARLDRRASGLSQELVFHDQQARGIHRELGEIERIARVETGTGTRTGTRTGTGTRGERATLVERLRAIGRFYHGKEQEYSQVGHRLARIEAMVGPPDDALAPGERQTLAARVDMAALSVQQETILHNSIPNGFPTATRIITSKFGNRIHPVTKVKSFHKGIDIRAKNRADVHATADGIVRTAGYSKLSGNHVIVQHNFGFESCYAHLHKMGVKPGDVIHKGDVVGISGNSGQSAGPHLHYEVRYLGKPIDPLGFLKWEFGSHEIFTQVKSIKWPSLINLINKQITHPTLQLSQLDPVSPERSK